MEAAEKKIVRMTPGFRTTLVNEIVLAWDQEMNTVTATFRGSPIEVTRESDAFSAGRKFERLCAKWRAFSSEQISDLVSSRLPHQG